MRALVLAILLFAAPAWAVCPVGEAAFVASATGGFRICPSELDVDGDAVPLTGYYQSCQVTAFWGAGKTATASITAPTAGTAALVSFAVAKGAGSATATCTNTDGVVSAVASAVVTFRRGHPAGPALSK